MVTNSIDSIEGIGRFQGPGTAKEKTEARETQEAQKVTEIPSDRAGNIWSRDDMEKAVDYANKIVQSLNRHLSFSVDETTERIVVKVIDGNTDEVIRQIPPEEMIQLAAHFQELYTLIFSEKY